MKKVILATKIIDYFKSKNVRLADMWDIANALYDGTMQQSNPRNGAVIANIVKAANNCDLLTRSGDNIHYNGGFTVELSGLTEK